MLAVIKGVLAKATDSAPGPDGLRDCTWRAARDEAAETLHALLWAFLVGEPVPEDLAVALLTFLPKGAQAKASKSAATPARRDRWAS